MKGWWGPWEPKAPAGVTAKSPAGPLWLSAGPAAAGLAAFRSIIYPVIINEFQIIAHEFNAGALIVAWNDGSADEWSGF